MLFKTKENKFIKEMVSKDKFLSLVVVYALLALFGILAIAYHWLPPGFAIVGHDSGLPLDAKLFLETRTYAWDDRLNFGLDNSVNFGSLTIHFFDWASSVASQVPYGGSFVSPFFWLGLIFVSGLILAYQFKEIFGRPFVFILPFLVTFNFYIFQSVFMLERGKFGAFSATLIMLAILLRVLGNKLGVITGAIISALVLSIFNGGGLFGITLYGGILLIVMLLLVSSFVKGAKGGGHFTEFKKTLSYLTLVAIFFLAFNAYSIIPFVSQFLTDDPNALFKESIVKGNLAWLEYVSRSTSFLNLFRFYGVPDWYGGWAMLDQPSESHAYAFYYLKNNNLLFVSFLFPIFAFSGLILAKKGAQRRSLALFGMIALIGLFLAAGSHKPLGFIYEFMMEKLPGFVLFRSAFYKFGIFYLLGMLCLLAFTISTLLERGAKHLTQKWGSALLVVGSLVFLGLWSAYHWVLFDETKVFAWNSEKTTRIRPPGYIFDFAKWAQQNNLQEKRVLLLPPVNKDWQADVYAWGYWSLSPLPYALSSASVLSNWHGLTKEETHLVNSLYKSITDKNESEFLSLAQTLNVRYLLMRKDVLTDASWSSIEKPESYEKAISAFKSIKKIKSFGEWDIYETEYGPSSGVYIAREINTAPDNYISLSTDFFEDGHTVGLSAVNLYKDITKLNFRQIDVYDCISCPLEKKAVMLSLPEVNITPDSMLYYFKEKDEKALLAQPKDPKSKTGDYLGLILKRVAEQKRMIDMGVNEKYLIRNAKVISEYLDKIYTSLSFSPALAQDFETAIQFLNYLGTPERVLNDYSTTQEFKSGSYNLVDETLGVIWRIKKIKEFFSPLLAHPEIWSNKKIYKVDIPSKEDYALFFPVGSFPQDTKGETILPKSIILEKGDQAVLLETQQDEKWLSASVPADIDGQARLIANFEELPNLFITEGSSLERLSHGDVACFQGRVTNFTREKGYEVRVSRTDRLSDVRIVFSDKSFTYSEKHKFLLGEDVFEVPAVKEGEFARYVFFPSVSANDITLFICSNNSELPKIDKVEVREYFSPSVLGIQRHARSNSMEEKLIPSLKYNRINPTLYEAEIKNSYAAPYLLVLNQRFNPSWTLMAKSEDGSFSKIDKHIKVDGYANGWLVTEDSMKNFKIIYSPQLVFSWSRVVSLSSLLGAAVLLVLLKRKKRNVKN